MVETVERGLRPGCPCFLLIGIMYGWLALVSAVSDTLQLDMPPSYSRSELLSSENILPLSLLMTDNCSAISEPAVGTATVVA